MNKHNNLPDRAEASHKRFGYTLFATQVMFLVSALNVSLFNNQLMEQHHLLHIAGIRLDILLLDFAALIVFPIHSILRKEGIKKANVFYFWLVAVVIAAMAFLKGGLQSIPIMGFPIIVILGAFYTERRVFLPICAFFCVMVLLMGANQEYGWFQGLATTGIARMVDCLILVSVSTYVAWLLSMETRQSLTNLREEHQRVVASQELIQHLADTDPLTGLANRLSARVRYDKMRSELQLGQESVVLYFVDLDNFKSINDLFDHQIGDELLRTVASRLQALAEPDTVVCRLGGDEFVLFLKAVPSFDFSQLAKKIVAALSEPHEILGTKAGITASIGIAVISEHDIEFNEARKRADVAMNKAKQSGKNTYHHYSRGLHQEYMKNLTILSALNHALERNLFELYFQPKVSLQTGQSIGAEALLRWTRENPHNLGPNEFIQVIESTELIHDIGAWVIGESCKACKNWHTAGHQISVAVNVSTLQLARNGFHTIVANALSDNNLAAHFLEIELTEHFSIQENPEFRAQLNGLKRLGVRLAIDDFGTGYSNMSYLTKIEVDVLKLDKSFVAQLEQSADSLAIVKAIIEMANVLGMKVVAEGVENENERTILKDLGCDIGQGFLWSKALSYDNLLQHLRPQPLALA